MVLEMIHCLVIYVNSAFSCVLLCLFPFLRSCFFLSLLFLYFRRVSRGTCCRLRAKWRDWLAWLEGSCFLRYCIFAPNFFTFPTYLHLRLGTLKLKLLLHNILRQFFVRHAFCFKTTHLLLFKDLLQRCLKLGPLQYFREASLAKAQLDHLICLVWGIGPEMRWRFSFCLHGHI